MIDSKLENKSIFMAKAPHAIKNFMKKKQDY